MKIIAISGFIAVAVIIGILLAKHQSRYRRTRLSTLFTGRIPLTGEQLYTQYFRPLGVRPDIPEKVRRILEEKVDADLSMLKDTDDFSKELSFFWEMDSMADVEAVIAFEEEFSIKISDVESQNMKTFRDMVMTIDRKIKGVQQSVPGYPPQGVGSPEP